MEFKHYSEIENTYNQGMINRVRDMEFDNPVIEYVCETKIDGSNFQCSINENNEFHIGSKIRYIDNNEDFKNCNNVIEKEDIKNKLLKMKDIIQYKINKNNFTIIVYGELCGGVYNSLPKVKNACKIQGIIQYHPDNKWIPFDIAIYNNNELIYMCTQDEVVELCKEVSLPYPIIKFKGTFNDCLNYPNDFNDDTGNILWNFPTIENNTTEGVVIKPNKPLWFNNGKRVLLKNKNDKFKEKQNKHKEHIDIPMSDIEKEYYEYAREFITDSRLMSIISKIDCEINEKSFGKILGMFLKDLWNDFNKEYNIPEIEEFDFNKIKKEISKETSNFIRPEFIKLLNQ